MQSIHLPEDTIGEESAKFAQAPLQQPLFLNSVPKSGSHLLRNIVRMFVPREQQYDRDFIQYANLRQHLEAFDSPSKLSWGHLLFSDISAIATKQARKILLVRDPYSWVIAKARFMLSDEFKGELDHLKKAELPPEELINLVIFGIHRTNPSLHETFRYNAVAWLGTNVFLVRYEELVAALKDLESDASEKFFLELTDACGIEIPDDWRERVQIGADPAHSGTARQNLTGAIADIPSELNGQQKRLVDYASPNLREMLGYV